MFKNWLLRFKLWYAKRRAFAARRLSRESFLWYPEAREKTRAKGITTWYEQAAIEANNRVGHLKLDLEFEEEKQRTADCLADACQFLSHDTSSTRLQLARALRLRAELIEAEVRTDRTLRSLVNA
jgi:hypothetical protein